MSHTPGPWTVRLHATNSINGSAIVTEDGHTIATMPRTADRPYDQKEADAHLIAAAPDLLDVCRKLLEWTDAYATHDGHTKAALMFPLLVNFSKATIAKAEGV